MFSRILRTSLAQPVTRCAFASTNRGGNLYTWGPRSAGLGFAIASGADILENPQRIDEFNGNVAKVSMGPTHTAVVTTDGDLYTFGYGQYGVLGHGDGNRSRYNPKLVEYFGENGIRVKDVVVGKHHTLALTEDGSLYSWGFGGKSMNPLANMFNPTFGALGLGSNAHRDVPTLIEDLNAGSIRSLYSGHNFAGFVTENGDLYNWGMGQRGVFADEANKHLKSPVINDALQHLKEDGHVIRKIKACGNHVLALFEDGCFYGWGDNRLGQLGIKKEVGIELYENIFHPEGIVDTNLKGKKIVDFDVGEEISVILTDTNEVYWFGLKLALEPWKLDFPTDKRIKRVSIANPYIVVVTEDNEIYTNDRVIGNSQENFNTGFLKVSPDVFNGGEVVELGGQYTNRYAVIRS